MAKKQRNQQIAVAFNYLIKAFPDPSGEIREEGFTEQEFSRVLTRLKDTAPLDDNDDDIIRQIKLGINTNFTIFTEPVAGLYFGAFEGAYYGQRIRNNLLGEIDPNSLNMRNFYYLITRLRDGKILIGVTYHGQYGDYDGFRSCVCHHLEGDYRISSRTLKNVDSEVGDGKPVSIKLTYRKRAARLEDRPLFGTSGEIAIKKPDFGDDFEERVIEEIGRINGTEQDRRRMIAQIVSQGEMIDIDEDEITGCSAIVRKDGRYKTVYFLGQNNQSTRYPLRVAVGAHGDADRHRVCEEMIRVMRQNIIPVLHNAKRA